MQLVLNIELRLVVASQVCLCLDGLERILSSIFNTLAVPSQVRTIREAVDVRFPLNVHEEFVECVALILCQLLRCLLFGRVCLIQLVFCRYISVYDLIDWFLLS